MCDVMIQFPESAATVVLHKELPWHMAIGEIDRIFILNYFKKQNKTKTTKKQRNPNPQK